jgi:dTDP-4-amino-4,6-dideoxygalactose transaminase
MLAGRPVRLPADGLPNADEVMARGILLPLSHAIDDETLAFVLSQLDEFLASVS